MSVRPPCSRKDGWRAIGVPSMRMGSGSRLQKGPNGMHTLLARGFKTKCDTGLGERKEFPPGSLHGSDSGQFERAKESAIGVDLGTGRGGNSRSCQLGRMMESAIERCLAGTAMAFRTSRHQERRTAAKGQIERWHHVGFYWPCAGCIRMDGWVAYIGRYCTVVCEMQAASRTDIVGFILTVTRWRAL
jgi:hypothetical protein